MTPIDFGGHQAKVNVTVTFNAKKVNKSSPTDISTMPEPMIIKLDMDVKPDQ